MNLRNAIQAQGLGPAFIKGIFGLEKESQRIMEDGTIAESSHPAVLGSRSYHPYIQTDFAESQLEFITPPAATLEEMMQWLMAIQDVAVRSLPKGEYLLPFSIPPILPRQDRVQIAKLENEADVRYREHLVKIYGNRKQMVSGIHFNFELDEEFLRLLHQAMQGQQPFAAFKTGLYMKLTRNFFRYEWLLTYLLGASVQAPADYFDQGQRPQELPALVRSLRASRYGYVNKEEVNVSFASLPEFVSSLEKMVEEGKLSEEKELYAHVRLRGAKKARELLQNGITYLEFRLFDLNPFEPYGISLADLRFVHAFLLYLLWIDETAGEKDIEEGMRKNNQTALEHPLSISAFRREGEQLLQRMMEMADTLDFPAGYADVIREKMTAMSCPEKTVAAKVMKVWGQESARSAAEMAQTYKKKALEKPYALTGFEDMELSTQILLADAIQKGLQIEILDRQDQFLALTHKGHTEYIKNGNMTAKDTYIAPLIMENKVVTKKILAKNGFVVPKSREYETAEAALADFLLFEQKGFVIKPKSTNYGLGITIFRNGTTFPHFETAVRLAFQEDSSILIEDFLEGTEYRFFVIGKETRAVLLRVPANVQADGIHSIRELIDLKNADPLRGENHRTPLEKIRLGEIELLTLRQQGYGPEDVPESGRTIQLRDNSNISTGGDSIDFTDDMHPSYKDLAGEMTRTLGAAVAGIDFLIPDHTRPSTKTEPGYGVIEANFNPMMMMHIYPYKGKSRRLTMDMLRLLFPEMNL